MGRQAAAFVLGLLVVVAAFAGCTSSSRSGPGGNTNTNQGPGYFSHSFNVQAKTDLEKFTFSNPGGSAYLSNGIHVKTGQLSLTLKDGSGKVVYQESFSMGSSGSTSSLRSGAPGMWTLEVNWIAATGSGAINVYGSA
ncbi:MAG TPA: hypothetical protein VNZ52_12780 [Candidatus Thermoplasmatota archaeon]|nr:hypothetical protein [Candidatus Thermoplasmatota archaeon]